MHYLPLLANQIYLETHTNTASPDLITIIAASLSLVAFFLSQGMGDDKGKSIYSAPAISNFLTVRL
ncbi:hypothetical protein X474_22890 [Dethiosulfatarculus sandiegensis]|uniref:Uncharacterized protein n=1 Tax=Dethiosulfatarculus sandiegensis TaxID=1429043 RepID=A0A0D2JQJ7_9BACT|nr:hypothetical protein X474_22890 [Dethiosulfatarculus sandiegensis]